jgi:5-methylcytosine-specific restriction enzyme A
MRASLAMSQLSELKPQKGQNVIDLVATAGLNVSDWKKFKGGPAKAASNPKYCYKWAFVQENKIVLSLWYENMHPENEVITQRLNMRKSAHKQDREPIQKKRALEVDEAIKKAYKDQLPLRVIVVLKASNPRKRLLDPVPWAVVSYDMDSGDCILERGAIPIEPANDAEGEDEAYEGFEGKGKRLFILHRKREARFRKLKIQRVQHKNNGRLVCEVPNCGFDFAASYGNLGIGYAQIHHKIPLSEAPNTGRKIVLDDLAVVCANCHAMIHRGGECRPLESLIPKQRKLRRG